jgi:hypothetical protein
VTGNFATRSSSFDAVQRGPAMPRVRSDRSLPACRHPDDMRTATLKVVLWCPECSGSVERVGSGVPLVYCESCDLVFETAQPPRLPPRRRDLD